MQLASTVYLSLKLQIHVCINILYPSKKINVTKIKAENNLLNQQNNLSILMYYKGKNKTNNAQLDEETV